MPASSRRLSTSGTRVGNTREAILGVLRDLPADEWVTTKSLCEVLQDLDVEIKERTVRNQLKGWVESKVVESERTGEKNGKRYRLTAKGRQKVAH